ncbi:MAG TPA: hypothetical protein VEA61_12390 [Allosphingosinicella sp.]|nr:hypothetical protein [Allosphingosinicella sp.]
MSINPHRPRNRRGRFCRPGEEDGTGERAGKPCRPAKGWPKAKEKIFFRELGIVCDLGLALKAAGLEGEADEVPERLKADAEFLAKWNAAIAAGYALLDLEMLGRVRFGDKRPEPKTAAEKKLRAVPTAVALQLLKHYHARIKGRPEAAGVPQPRPLLNAREIRKRLDAKLSDFNRRMGGEG